MLVIFIALLIISNGQACILGRNDLQPTSPVTSLRGLFIQEQGRAPCDGKITAWKVCYYNLRNFSNIYRIHLEVWRKVSFSQLNFIGDNRWIINVTGKERSFECTELDVNPEDSISVKQDDFLAVYNVGDSILPVVTANAGGTGRVFFLKEAETLPSTVYLPGNTQSRTTTNLSNYALHVTATINGTSMVAAQTSTPTLTILTFEGIVNSRTFQDDLSHEVVNTSFTTGNLSFTSTMSISTLIIAFFSISMLVMVGLLLLTLVLIFDRWRRKARNSAISERSKVHTGFENRSEPIQLDIPTEPFYDTISDEVGNINATQEENQNSFHINANVAYSTSCNERGQVLNSGDIMTNDNSVDTIARSQ